jgi:tetratricopeptide (TPR) repeat protein
VKLLRQEFTPILATLTKRVTEFPDQPRYRQDLAQIFYDIGDGFAEIGEPAPAESAYHQCIELLRRLIVEVPSEKGYRWRWGHACRSWAFVLRSMPNRSEDARHALEDAEKTFADLSAQSPKNADYTNFLADTSFQLGEVLEATGKKREALDRYRKSLELRERLCTQFPKAQEGRTALGELLCRLGTASEQAGQIAEAVQLQRRALTVFEKLVADFPAISHYRWQLGNCRDGLAGLFAANHQEAEAETQYREALALWEKLVAESRSNQDYRYHLGQTLRRRGDALVVLKRNHEAERAFQRSLDTFRSLATDFPEMRHLHGEHLFSNWKLGWFLKDSGRPQEAVELLRRALEISAKTAVDFPKDGVAQADLSRSYFELIEILIRQSKHAEAARLAVESARVEPRKWDECQRAIASLETCAELANKDAALSSAERKAAINECSKKSAAIWIDASKRGVASPEFANNLAWKLATRPEIDLRSPSVAVELARKSVELAPKQGSYWNTLGAAVYRTGDWKAADAALRKSMELRDGGDSFDWFFLAMAQRQAGDKDEARKRYDLAVVWMDKNQPKNEELRRFREEAKELLK